MKRLLLHLFPIIVLTSSVLFSVNCVFAQGQSESQEIPDSDIWLADSVVLGLTDTNTGQRMPSLYNTFLNFSDPIYMELGGYLLEDEPLVDISEAWTVCLNSDFHKNPNYIYEAILMEYLLFDADSLSVNTEFDRNSLNTSLKLYSAVAKDMSENTIDYISDLTVEEAAQFYENANISADINKAIGVVQKFSNTTNEFLKNINQYAALQEVKENKIILLKEASKAAQELGDMNFVSAVNATIKALESTEIKYIKDASAECMYGIFWDTVWEKLCNASPVLKAIDWSQTGVDLLFDATNSMSNNLKLALLYTVDCYFRSALSEANITYLNNTDDIDSAKTIISCLTAYEQFRIYGNDYAKEWLDGYMSGGILKPFLNQIFYRENLETAEDLKMYCESQIQTHKSFLECLRNMILFIRDFTRIVSGMTFWGQFQ